MITDFGEKIRLARNQKGYSQRELARLINESLSLNFPEKTTKIPQNSISIYESGKGYPSMEVLRQLCIILDLSADDLIDLNYSFSLPTIQGERMLIALQADFSIAVSPFVQILLSLASESVKRKTGKKPISIEELPSNIQIVVDHYSHFNHRVRTTGKASINEANALLQERSTLLHMVSSALKAYTRDFRAQEPEDNGIKELLNKAEEKMLSLKQRVSLPKSGQSK